MRLFNYDICQHKGDYDAKGYINLRKALSAAFIQYMADFYKETRCGRVGLLPKNSTGQKSQFKFDFPSREFAENFKDAIVGLTGIRGDKTVLSERHLNVYADTAMDCPYPHKDRCASRITVGFPVSLGDETALYLFPELNQDENPNETAIYLDEGKAEDIYASPDAVRIEQEVGDLVVFPGSTIYHGRIKPASTAILYCKLNDVGRDPLGEDIFKST